MYTYRNGDDAVELSVYMILKSGVGVAAEGKSSERLTGRSSEDIFAGKDYSNICASGYSSQGG